ncbi:MAG: ABC transporter permease, partial [Bryobacteraceae bacterium]|nr:ABC transporter permease [Bryobacteraceae bacterium]
MRNDLRFAIRGLLKQKAFAAAAILTLALGLGANTAIFSVVHGVLLRPLPYPEPDSIVTLQTAWRSRPTRGGNVSGPDFLDWKQQASSFQAMAWFMGQESGVKAGEVGEFAGVYVVTPEFFEVMRVLPAAGRLFSNDETKPNGANAILVSTSFARSHYGQASAALGRTIRLASQSFPIVGVMPEGFHYPVRNTTRADFWVPSSWIGEQWSRHRTAHNFSVVGRMKAGVTLDQARMEMNTIASRLEQAYPKDDKDKLILVNLLRDTITGSTKSTLQLLMVAVGLLLLLSCANVANMLLARATSRGRELALRAALGASRSQIIRQLLVESAVLAVLAASIGAGIGIYGTDLLVTLAGQNLPRADEVRVDLAMLVFVILCSAACVFVFGLVPALQASRIDLNHALRQGNQKGVLGGMRSQGMRNALVVAEIALSLVLAVGAGLLFRTMTALADVDLGFQPDQLVVMNTSVAAKDDGAVRKAAYFYRDLLPQLRTVPGVEAAAGVMGLPAGKKGSNGSYMIEGRAAGGSQSQQPNAGFNVTTPQFFLAMKTPVLRGRDFEERDTYEAPGVAIVNRSFVLREFPNGDAIGKRIRCGLDRDIWMTIVG